MPWARASELERLLECPGSAVLPREPDRTIEAGQWGRMVHRWKATGVVEPEPGFPNHGPLLDDRIRRTNPDRRTLWPGSHELAVWLVPLGSAALLHGDDPRWKSGAPPDAISGTTDHLGEVLGDPWIDDLKTGREPPGPLSPQTLFYALAVARCTHPPPGRVLVSITHWPRYPRDGLPTRSWATVTAHQLDAFEHRLERLRQQVVHLRGLVPDVTASSQPPSVPPSLLGALRPGSACTYCPSRNSCPAQLSTPASPGSDGTTASGGSPRTGSAWDSEPTPR